MVYLYLSYYSITKKNKILYGALASSIISFFHFFSSIAVVVIFLLFNKAINFTSLPLAKYVASGLLLALAIKAWFEGPHLIKKKKTKTLWGIASYAFVLGFIHEEEFAILGFCIGGNNCLALMITYAIAVSFALMTITLISIKSYQLIKPKIKKYEKYLHKIFAGILFLVAMSYLFRF